MSEIGSRGFIGRHGRGWGWPRRAVVVFGVALPTFFGQPAMPQDEGEEDVVIVRVEVLEAVIAISREPEDQEKFSGMLTLKVPVASEGRKVEFEPQELYRVEDPERFITVNGILWFDGESWHATLQYTRGKSREKLGLDFSIVNQGFPLEYFCECTHFGLCLHIRTRPIEEDLPLFFRRGDVNDDGATDVSDAVAILSYLFLDDGLDPRCLDAADVNDDGSVEVIDALDELAQLFLGRSAIAMPAGFCGVDVTEYDLACDGSVVCESILSK